MNDDVKELEVAKVVTPASLFIGPAVLLLGALAAAFGGSAGGLLILLGAVVTVVGVFVRARRAREAYEFNLWLVTHEGDDD